MSASFFGFTSKNEAAERLAAQPMLKIRHWFLRIGLLCILAIALGSCIGIHHTIDNLLYDNYKHYLPCEQLPTRQEVNRVLEGMPTQRRQIKAVHPGFVTVTLAEDLCPHSGRADILILFASHQDRIAIERNINSDRFFGIPYRLINT